jgi:hypothetical protein
MWFSGTVGRLKEHLKKSIAVMKRMGWSRNTFHHYSAGTLGFLADNSTIYYQSEATGYSHLYTHNLNTKKNSS